MVVKVTRVCCTQVCAAVVSIFSENAAGTPSEQSVDSAVQQAPRGSWSPVCRWQAPLWVALQASHLENDLSPSEVLCCLLPAFLAFVPG